MSANYYWRYNICACCNRYDEAHVGKFGSGFQGHFSGNDPRVVSWEDWKRVLRGQIPFVRHGATAGELWSSDQGRVDVEEFIAEREGVATEHRGRRYRWMVDYRDDPLFIEYSDLIGVVAPDGHWLDVDGWSFSGRDFS